MAAKKSAAAETKTKKAAAAKLKKTTAAKKAVAKKTSAVPKTKSAEAKSGGTKKTTVRGKLRKLNFSEYEGKTLVIVESPAKAKTLEKILGGKYKVLASVGHVRDLPKGRLAIDVEHDFEPEYIQVRGKADLIKELKGASQVSQKTLLAADPDREGEAIAWHVVSLLEIDPKSKCRIRMHEITPHGVKSAVADPEPIDIDRVDAQQARRVLDRLVGYQLSPLLWFKVQRGLSAGRVQSVALRIICEREDEIEKFKPEEYYLVDVECDSMDGKRHYTVRLDKYKGKNITVKNADEAAQVESAVKKAGLAVESYKTKESERAALPPFKTSTLQQEASRRLGFAPKRTMRIAQSLYEGIDLPGRGPTGLITYMRTDSLRLAPEALDASRAYIAGHIGKEYLAKAPNSFTPKGKAQDAHEAIRATDASITPDSVKGFLTAEQFRLYELIWSCFIASQMAPAKMARTTLEVRSGDYLFKQTGIVVVFDGWGKVFPLGVKNVTIDPAIESEALKLEKVLKEQRFTQPPSRYTEAGLVKVLEEKGIGRPSTYASILDTITLRGYVVRGEEDKKLAPTKLGRIVNAFLVKYFPNLINVDFTAGMEEELDEIETGSLKWRSVIAEFWKNFKPTLDDVSEHAEDMRPEPEKIGEQCPECGKDLIIKRGRFGEFISCTGYPDCRYTRKLIRTTGIKCPKCEEGELVRRRATQGKMKGRFFYGCSRYPECDFVAWKKPENKAEASETTETNEPGTYETDM